MPWTPLKTKGYKQPEKEVLPGATQGKTQSL